MSTNKKNKINIDIDGYFRSATEAEEELKIRYHNIHTVYAKYVNHPDDSVRDLVGLYYWQMRSSFVLIDDQIHNRNNVLNAFKAWQEASMSSAIALTDFHLHHGLPPQPDWMEILREEYLEHIEEEFPEARAIKITATMEPRFNARALPNGSIKISSHVYAFLKALNASLFLAINDLLDDEGKLSQGKGLDIAELGRFSIPHYIYLHDYVSTAVLPYHSIPSMNAYTDITQLTNLQVHFIIAHEYAHFALGHIDHPAQTKLEREQQEEEADMFALKICYRIIATSDTYEEYQLWNAYRFLYQYQIISEIISSLLRKKRVDVTSLSFEKKRRPLLKEFISQRGIENFGNTIELAGTISLLELKGKILELGQKGIKDISNILVHAPLKRGVEPWWKKLQTKI